MIHRLLMNALLCAAVFLVPGLLAPSKLLHPAPWVGFLAGLLIMMSQPPIDFRESASRSAADRGSALAILTAMILAQLAAVIDFNLAPPRTFGVLQAAGAAIVFAGMALRLAAIRTLGRYFTSTVRVAGDHRVIEAGPYRRLRHPSYTGALLVALGTALLFASALGALLVAGLCVPVYLYRIAAEEHALCARPELEYQAYRRRTWGLIPGIR